MPNLSSHEQQPMVQIQPQSWALASNADPSTEKGGAEASTEAEGSAAPKHADCEVIALKAAPQS